MRSPAKSSGETGAVRPTADKELKLANGHQVGLSPSPAKPEDAFRPRSTGTVRQVRNVALRP